MQDLMTEVANKIAKEGLTVPAAASQIGVGASTLRKHLDGNYLRSDSAAKYRNWLNGVRARRDLPSAPPQRETQGEWPTISDPWEGVELVRPKTPFRIVDLFSGCGGLSLGFDLEEDGAAFETVLAVDIEQAMIDVYDDNRVRMGKQPNGRMVDLSDLKGEAEALAFYLDHILQAGYADDALAEALDQLPRGPLPQFIATINDIDRRGEKSMRAAMSDPALRKAMLSTSEESLKQTSVIRFHDALHLPQPGARDFRPPLLWWSSCLKDDHLDQAGKHLRAPKSTRGPIEAELRDDWRGQVETLREKTALSGRGQLASSARRIKIFLDAIDAGLYDKVFDAWIEWRTERDSLRAWYFRGALAALRAAYEPWQVEAIVGGPPCQGFSRIGRGKIRSLRESGVQARVDAEAGDQRNRLMFAYVLVVSALRPSFFVFENVRHFQSEVKTPDGVFRAPEVLAEAIEDISSDGTSYEVSSRILNAAKHGVPQRRERFFMTGVRRDAFGERANDIAEWVLALPHQQDVPLRVALAGLPQPHYVGSDVTLKDTVEISEEVDLASGSSDAAGRYLKWIRGHLGAQVPTKVDSHVARRPRADDAAWFEMMGPGKRWLDYRVDRSPTLQRLAEVMASLSSALERLGDSNELLSDLSFDDSEVKELARVVDGSLALRLLLESLPPQPGELSHHLASDSYLSKRDGNHGDWLARLSAEEPTKTMTSHMGKDTYSYVHPYEGRTLSVREAARVQTFPDWFSFGTASLVDGFRVIGNAVPPLLSAQIASRMFKALCAVQAPGGN